MHTIKELEEWMRTNNIRNTFTPSVRYRTDEGEGLEEISGMYVWYSNEKGQRHDLQHFKSEAEAVQYLQNYLLKKKPYYNCN
jgi:hypothetical protein